MAIFPEQIHTALEGRIVLRENEITLKDAFRKLELPMYGVVAAASRVVGWGFDIYQAVHGRLFDPNVIATSLMIKNIPPVATGCVYFTDDGSHAWKTVAGLRVRSELAKAEPRQYVIEPLKNGLYGGLDFISSSLSKLREVSTERELSFIDKAVAVTVGGVRFGRDFTYRTVRFGWNVFSGTARYGYESSREVLSIGSKVWFVNRGIRRISPIVHAVDEVLHPQLSVDLPKEFEYSLIGTSYENIGVRRL